MRRFLAIAAVLVALAVPLAVAQEATINAPAARPAEAKYTVEVIQMTASDWYVLVSVKDASNNEIRKAAFGDDPAHPTATVSALLTAIDTVRTSETGTVLRRANFRILGFLVDQGYLVGVTLVP
jgi:hypothetical protein